MIGVALQERRVIASPIEPLKFLSVDLENQASFVSDPLFELQAIEEIRKCGPGKVDVSDVALGRVNARKALTYTRNLQCKSTGGTRLSSQSPDHRHHN